MPSFSKIACFNTASNLLPDVLGDFRDEVSQSNAQEAIDKCSELPFDKSYKFFALGYNGQCRSGPKAREQYHSKPAIKDTNCPNGIGIGRRIVVYTFGKFSCIYPCVKIENLKAFVPLLILGRELAPSCLRSTALADFR